MLIAATQVDAVNGVLEFYVSGCTLKCPGCHNYELQTFGIGDSFTFNQSDYIAKAANPLVEQIAIMGGEPLDQEPPQLLQMIQELHKVGKPIVLFTGYDMDEIPEYTLEALKPYLFAIKTGKWDIDLACTDNIHLIGDWEISLASSNQELHIL